jgi:hypothetical protein
MSAVMSFEWKFSPADYFEEAIEISRQDYTMSIAGGTVRAQVDAGTYEADPDIRRRMHDALNDRFLGVQLLTHRPYELSQSTKTRIHPDGRRDIFIEPEPVRITLSGGSVDFQIRDKDGNLIADSKRDRIEKKKTLAALVSTHRASDALLASLLRSQSAAVRDANNELVHLYEIREALSTKFADGSATRAILGIGAAEWSRLGQLCNDEPLRQGRHRGKAIATLRDATEDELAEARAISRNMIEAYLRHLERCGNP